MYGDIAVEMLSEKEKEDWTVREFKLSLVRHLLFKYFRTSQPNSELIRDLESILSDQI